MNANVSFETLLTLLPLLTLLTLLPLLEMSANVSFEQEDSTVAPVCVWACV
jgi:hypothetical protein